MDSNHIRVKEIFLKAIEIPAEERRAFVQKECEGDSELEKEVLTLIANHNEDSIFETPIKQEERNHESSPSETEFELTLKKIQKKRSQKLRYNLLLIGIILALITIGIWTQQKMKSSIIALNEHSLEHNVEATVRSLHEWVKDKENIMVALSKDSMIVSSVEYLTDKYGMGKYGDPDSIWNDPIHIALQNRLAPIISILESPSFSIIDASGFRIAGSVKRNVGQQLNEEGLRIILPNLHKTGPKFTRPFLQEKRTVLNIDDSSKIPIAWIDCSILFNGKPKATLGFSFYADEGFNKILSDHRIGETGHTFAFDENGFLISNIKDVDELIDYEILKENANPISTLKLLDLQSALKDNNELDRGKYESAELIAPVKLALSGGSTSDTAQIFTISEPYHTFNGNKAIGAYVWLPNYNFGIVSELPTEETLKPVHYLNLILIILIGLLIGFVIYSFISSYQVAKLHKEIGETSKLGQYTLIKHIGEGGMGEVYLAKHAFLTRPNAVKLLKSEFSHNKVTIKRFEREVQLASELTNPHTIQIHDFGYTEGDRFYYAMEFLDGITLEELIKIEGPLSIDRVVFLLKQMCYSLSETHEHGLVHRDIKPMNIMICKLGGLYDFVKVLDFGLVKDIEGDDLEMTQEAIIQGTPVYMAPERFLRPQLSHPKSDIYSIGMVAYYLVTGRKVFDHIDRSSLLSEILNAEPKPMNEFTKEPIPKAFSELVMRCLAKDMEERPENIGEILTELEKLDDQKWNQIQARIWWEANIDMNK